MDETVIVIMLRDKQTGFLEKELTSCVIEEYDELLLNAFVSNEDDGLYVVLKLTCSVYVSDDEFDDVYDYYDEAVYSDFDVSCQEIEDCYNPTWEFVFRYDEAFVEDNINSLLKLHAGELEEVFKALKSREK